jgi:hypothetical protein
MHVKFADGTSHTYDDVPDDVTQEQVDARAATDYPDKEVGETREGAHPFTPEKPPEDVPPTAGEAAVGVGKMAYDFAMENPKTAAGIAETGLALMPQAAERIPVAGKFVTAAKAPFRMGQAAIDALNRVGQQPVAPEAFRTPPAPAPSGLVDVQGRPMAPSVPQAPPAAPKAPPIGGPAAEQGANFVQRITQEYAPKITSGLQQAGKYIAPIVNNPVMRVLGSAPVMGAQMALIPSTLNANEQEELRRRRTMAPTIR